MKTAHNTPQKTTLILSGIALGAVLLGSHVSQGFAQSASNPFVPNPVTAQDTTLESPQPVLYDATDATRTLSQDKISLTAIPPRLGDDGSLTAAPGEKLQVQLRVRNLSEETIAVVTSAQDFILSPDGETPVPINDDVSNRWSLASWLTITPTEHQIAPKGTAGVNVLIEVPEDALPGGHYAMVLHTPGTNTNTTGDNGAATSESSSAIDQRVGTLLYVVVEGPINEEAYVRDFSFPDFTEYGPVPFEFVVENNSDVHITPQISVEIYNLFNQKVDTIPVEPKNIFPLTSRRFSGAWDRVWGMGLYNAKLVMSYGSSGAVVIAHTSFWLLPIKIVIAVLSLLIVLLLVGLAIKRHLNHKRDLDEQRIKELETQIQEMQTQGNRDADHDDSME